MEDFMMPAAISGVKNPEKIRVVLYANNRLAHVPLSEILKLAAPFLPAAAPASASAFLRLKAAAACESYSAQFRCGGVLAQYGFYADKARDSGAGDNSRALPAAENTAKVRLPAPFASADYCVFISPCAAEKEAVFAAAAAGRTAAEFAVFCRPLPREGQAEESGGGGAPVLRKSFFWLALGAGG